MFNCNGTFDVSGVPIRCSNRSGHGSQNYTLALTNSCNPAFMQIGLRLGPERFLQYFEGFGLSGRTGIDLPGESNSIYVDADMSNVDLASSSFGQVNKITPIQMITAYAAAINGGYLVTPHIMDKIEDEDGNLVRESKTNIKRQVVSAETSETMRQQLESVVANKHETNAYIEGYRIGGKSGTSEKLDEYNGANEESMQYVASYCCFAPADDPEVILLVMADEPDTSINYYGGSVAAPYARNIMEDVLPYLGFYHETSNTVESNNVTVPMLQDKSIEEAKSMLAELGLSCEVVGNGSSIIRQCPATGFSIEKSGIVLLYTDDATEPQYVEVPDLLGKTAVESEEALREAGLNLVTIGASAENSGAIVQFQSEQAGSSVEKGTVITLTMVLDDQAGW